LSRRFDRRASRAPSRGISVVDNEAPDASATGLSSPTASGPLALNVGNIVEANWRNQGRRMRAVVVKKSGNHMYDIKFFNGGMIERQVAQQNMVFIANSEEDLDNEPPQTGRPKQNSDAAFMSTRDLSASVSGAGSRPRRAATAMEGTCLLDLSKISLGKSDHNAWRLSTHSIQSDERDTISEGTETTPSDVSDAASDAPGSKEAGVGKDQSPEIEMSETKKEGDDTAKLKKEQADEIDIAEMYPEANLDFMQSDKFTRDSVSSRSSWASKPEMISKKNSAQMQQTSMLSLFKPTDYGLSSPKANSSHRTGLTIMPDSSWLVNLLEEDRYFNAIQPPPPLKQHPFCEFIGTEIIDAFELEQRLAAINSLFKNQDEEDKKHQEAERTRSRSNEKYRRQTQQRDTMNERHMLGWQSDPAPKSSAHQSDFSPQARKFIETRMKIHAPSSKHVHFNPLLYKDIVSVMAWLAQPSTPDKESMTMDYEAFQDKLEQIVLHSKNPVRSCMIFHHALKAFEEATAKHKRLTFVTRNFTVIREHFQIFSRTLVKEVPIHDLNRVLMFHSPSAIEIALSLHDDNFLVEPVVKSYISELWLGSFNTADDDSVLSHWKHSFSEMLLLQTLLVAPAHWNESGMRWRDITTTASNLNHHVSKIIDPNTILKSPIASFISEIAVFAFLLLLHQMTIFLGLWYQVGLSLTEGTMLVMWGAFLLEEIKEVYQSVRSKKFSSYIGNMWNQIDWCIHILFSLYTLVSYTDFSDWVYNTFHYQRKSASGYAIGLVSIFLWFRLLDVLSISKRLGSMVISLRYIISDICTFLVIYGICLIGFATVFLVWFGGEIDHKVEGFETLGKSLYNLFLAAHGQYDVDDIVQDFYHHTMARILISFYLLVGVVMLFNLLIAIVNDAYAGATTSQRTLTSFTRHKLKEVLRFRQSPSSQGPPLVLFNAAIYPILLLFGVSHKKREAVYGLMYNLIYGIGITLVIVLLLMTMGVMILPIFFVTSVVSATKTYWQTESQFTGSTSGFVCLFVKTSLLGIVYVIESLVFFVVLVPWTILYTIWIGGGTYVMLLVKYCAVNFRPRRKPRKTKDKSINNDHDLDDALGLASFPSSQKKEVSYYDDGGSRIIELDDGCVLRKRQSDRFWEYLMPRYAPEAGVYSCNPDEGLKLLKLLRELERLDKRQSLPADTPQGSEGGEENLTGELPRQIVVDLLTMFFKPSKSVMSEVKDSGDITRAAVDYLRSKYHIEATALDSLEVRLSNRRSLVGRARKEIDSERAIVRRIVLKRLDKEHYVLDKGLPSRWEVSGGSGEDLYIEHCQPPDEGQNDFIQCLYDIVDQYTVMRDVYEESSDEAVPSVRVLYTELLTHMIVYGPFDRNGEVILHPAGLGSGYRPIDSLTTHAALAAANDIMERKAQKVYQEKIDSAFYEG